jgi:hypothetical protein
MRKSSIPILLGLGTAIALHAIPLPMAKVTLHAISEDGRNLAGVDAQISFLKPEHKPGMWGSADTFSRSGKTDANGLFVVEENAGFEIHYAVSGPNYYKTRGRFDFSQERDGRYVPWNPNFDIILKRIINPIPMYAKRLEKKLPVEAWPVGFDLIESDWVAPYGRGKASDIVFEVSRIVRSPRDFNAVLKLTFPNQGDGIVAVPVELQDMNSELRLPHEAPETGYTAERVWHLGGSAMSYEERQRLSYFYRVRTSVNSAGRPATALYGKIHGDVELYVGTQVAKPGIGFTYYLNPTPNDRNIEFDPKRNLFTKLKDDERVTTP